MFGYVLANKDELAKEQLERYAACYCGLCKTLHARCGYAGRITLNYDMTFLVLLLTSLYEPDTREGRERCAVHPVKTHPYWENRITAYAADMNVALAYHNCMDDWKDDKNIVKYAEAALLKKKYAALEKQYPRQCSTIAEGLRVLGQLEAENNCSLDAAANSFGNIMAELFVYEEDRWSPVLRRTAAALGRFIYVMDAYEDVRRDVKKGKYNPLGLLYGRPGFDKYMKDILRMHIAECTMEFEKLPLVQDADILRNILYSGVWTRYLACCPSDHAETKETGSGKDLLADDGSI